MKGLMFAVGFILWLGWFRWFINTYSPDRPGWWLILAIVVLFLGACAWDKWGSRPRINGGR